MKTCSLAPTLRDWLSISFDAVEPQTFPLPDEPFVATWQTYPSQLTPAWLRQRLVQLQFTIDEGRSHDPIYRAVTRLGMNPPSDAAPLSLSGPFQLVVHPTWAGRVPVIYVVNRTDFVRLVQALAYRNEPVPIPDSQGASMIAGYNNWDRIFAHKARWRANTEGPTELKWQQEFRQLRAEPWRFQDRLLLLCDWPYSAVEAAQLGLKAAEWRGISSKIRTAHESAHYFTKRIYGEMRRHLHDELLADFAGIVAGFGRFSATTFLTFLGLEEYPTYRKGGRLENYLTAEQKTQPQFKQVCHHIVQAASAVEQFDHAIAMSQRDQQAQAHALMAIAETSLRKLAEPHGSTHLLTRFQQLQTGQ